MNRFIHGLVMLCLIAGTVVAASPATDAGTDQALARSGSAGYVDCIRNGNRAAHAREYGFAALWYERALVVSDGFAPVRANLELVREASGARRYEIEVHPLVRGLFWMYYSCTRSALLGLLFFCGIAIVLLVAAGLWREWTGRSLFRLTLFGLLAVLVAGLVFYVYRVEEASDPERAVLVHRAALHARRGEGDRPLAVLPAATAVRIIQETGADMRIVLPGGASGWIAATNAARIRPVTTP